MNTQNPFVFGYSWQMHLVKPNLYGVNDKHITEIAHRIRRKDARFRSKPAWGTVVHNPGALRHFDELLERTIQPFGDMKAYCREHDLILWPSSITTLKGDDADLSFGLILPVHPETLVEARNAFIKYEPALIALMANAPIRWPHVADYKSYQLLHAWSFPPMPMNADGYQPEWNNINFGGDGLGIGCESLSIDQIDSPCSPRLICEFIAFAACFVTALVDDVSAHGPQPMMSPERYAEYTSNRWLASKYGLQATFHWKGNETPVTEILEDMLVFAEPRLKQIGTSAQDFTLTRQMLDKRQTQADYVLAMLPQRDDPHVLYRTLANFIAESHLFETYLAEANQLPLAEQMTLEDAIVEKVKRDNPYWKVLGDVRLPPLYLNRLLAKLEAEGRIQTEKHPEKGLLLSNGLLT